MEHIRQAMTEPEKTHEMMDMWYAYLDDELSPEERLRVEHGLAKDPEAARRFAVLQEELRATKVALEPLRELAIAPFDVERHLADVHTRLQALTIPSVQPQRSWWMWGSAMSAGLAAMALVVWAKFVPVPSVQPLQRVATAPFGVGGASGQQWVIKGSRIRMLHQTKGASLALWSEAKTKLSAGDMVQFAYTLAQPTHVLVVSIDAKGKVARYVPLEQPKSLRLMPGKGTIPKDQAIELDESLGWERFWILSSPQAISFQQVKQVLSRHYQQHRGKFAAFTSLPGPWQIQQTLLIQKVARHGKPQEAPTVRGALREPPGAPLPLPHRPRPSP